jgi:hypothetical protein
MSSRTTTSRSRWGRSCGSSGSTLENWQSEFLLLFSFVVLSALFIHRGSAESKDSDEQMQKSLDRIEKRLKALEGGEKSGAKS